MAEPQDLRHRRHVEIAASNVDGNVSDEDLDDGAALLPQDSKVLDSSHIQEGISALHARNRKLNYVSVAKVFDPKKLYKNIRIDRFGLTEKNFFRPKSIEYVQRKITRILS